MIRLRTRKPSTRELLRLDHNAQPPRRVRWLYNLLLITLLTLGLVYLNRYTIRVQSQEQIATLMLDNQVLSDENQQLQEQLVQNELKSQQDQAVREELSNQIHKMSAQIKELQNELAFFRQRKDKSK